MRLSGQEKMWAGEGRIGEEIKSKICTGLLVPLTEYVAYSFTVRDICIIS